MSIVSDIINPYRIYFEAGILAILLGAFGWWTVHERAVEHDKDVAHEQALKVAQQIKNEQVEARAQELAKADIDAYKQTLAAPPAKPDHGVLCVAAGRGSVPGTSKAGSAAAAAKPSTAVH
jgi:hypothetical protein